MKIQKIIFAILLFDLIFISCGQSKTTKQVDIEISPTQTEKIYTKVISDSTNKLTGKVEKLEVNYHIIGCACPNWIRIKDEIGRAHV